MIDGVVRFVDAIASISWLEVVRAFAPMATAIVGIFALKNWQRQDKAKREVEFLDALIEVAHSYIAEISKPLKLLELAKIGMECHAPTWENGDKSDLVVKGAVAYIQKDGERVAKRLLETLEAIQPSTIRLRSLVAKGQVFKFDNYAKCQSAVAELTAHFDRVEACTAVIGSPTLNWEHPMVLDTLKSVVGIDLNDIRENIKKNNVALIEFASNTYTRTYG